MGSDSAASYESGMLNGYTRINIVRGSEAAAGS